jgi:hypothetical protein
MFVVCNIVTENFWNVSSFKIFNWIFWSRSHNLKRFTFIIWFLFVKCFDKFEQASYELLLQQSFGVCLDMIFEPFELYSYTKQTDINWNCHINIRLLPINENYIHCKMRYWFILLTFRLHDYPPSQRGR